MLDFAATFEDDGVARLDGERGDLGDGVGARLEDHGEDAERHGDLFERKYTRESFAATHPAGGVGQLANGAHAFDHGAKFFGREQQALKEGLRELAGVDEGLGGGDVGGVSGEDSGGVGFECGGDGFEGIVFGCGGQGGEGAAGGLGGASGVEDGSFGDGGGKERL